MSNKLEELSYFYAQLLADIGLTDQDGGGLLSFVNGDGKYQPVLLKKKRLCLPTYEIMRDGDWENRTAFHPLSEQVNCGPSDVLNALKEYIRIVVTDRYNKVAIMLLLTAVNSDKKAITPKSMDLMTELADADQKTYEALATVLASTTAKPEGRFMSIILQANLDKDFLRSSMVSFPIMDSSDDGDATTFFGQKMPRKTKDKRLLVSLLKYVLGENYNSAYSFGSNDRTAPFFHALLQSFEKLAKQLNLIIDRHSDDIVGLADLKFKMKWADTMPIFAQFAAKNEVAAPPTPGNRGELLPQTATQELASVFDDKTEPPKPEIAVDVNRPFDPYDDGRRSRRDELDYRYDDRRDRRDRDDYRDNRDYRRDDRRDDRRDRDDRGPSRPGMSFSDYMRR